MLIGHAILAAVAVGALALRPRSTRATFAVALAALLDLAFGASASQPLAVVPPLAAFLFSALTLAALVERSGFAERVASALAARAGESALVLYAFVCATSAVLTAAVSLDAAVVLVIPLLSVLVRRVKAPFAPLFLGAVAVANAASIAVPQGNPTNLLIIDRLGLSPTAFLEHMLVPGLAAATVCAAAVAFSERRALAAPLHAATRRPTPLAAAEWHAAASLLFAAAVAWAAPIVGLAPWWPFTAAVALAVAARPARLRPILPWRIAVQVAGLLIVIQALGFTAPVPGALGLPGFLAIAVAVGGASALVNNLPVSVCATGLVASGTSAYSASVGLAIGSLATPHGSVATLIATELAGSSAPPLGFRRFGMLAAAALLSATLIAWTTL